MVLLQTGKLIIELFLTWKLISHVLQWSHVALPLMDWNTSTLMFMHQDESWWQPINISDSTCDCSATWAIEHHMALIWTYPWCPGFLPLRWLISLVPGGSLWFMTADEPCQRQKAGHQGVCPYSSHVVPNAQVALQSHVSLRYWYGCHQLSSWCMNIKVDVFQSIRGSATCDHCRTWEMSFQVKGEFNNELASLEQNQRVMQSDHKDGNVESLSMVEWQCNTQMWSIVTRSLWGSVMSGGPFGNTLVGLVSSHQDTVCVHL